MSVVIKEVTSKKELKKFVKFNIELYKGNPYHVPGLIEEEMVTLDKKKNPAFEVCDAIYFLAYKDGKVVGRIAGMINRRSNETWNQKYARFGFVDFIDDAEVVDALFGAVEKWAALAWGATPARRALSKSRAAASPARARRGCRTRQ